LSTKHASTLTAAADPADIGATVAALLDQMPDIAFATKLRDAFDADLLRIYDMGLRHGSGNAWNAIDSLWAELGLEKSKPAVVPATPKRHLMLVGGA